MFYGRLDSWSAATRPDVQSGGAGGGAGRLGVGGGVGAEPLVQEDR